MYDSLSDAYLISQYHQEYLELINRFHNFKKTGPFIRYYNINYQESIKHPVVETTFDIYNLADIKFDIYELTPTYNITPIINTTTNAADKKGQMFDGVTSIVTYTIKTPRINDLVSFYNPIKSGEIFRVINYRTSINAYYSDPQLVWYEMDLEIAPIKDTSQLKISRHYIFDAHKEKYYNYEDYKAKTELIKNINSCIDSLRTYYNRINDLYLYQNLIPILPNQAICYFKDYISQNNDSAKLFNRLEKPYGFLHRFNNLTPEYDFQTPTLSVYNLTTEEYEDYVWNREEINDLNNLFGMSQDLYNFVHYNQEFF